MLKTTLPRQKLLDAAVYHAENNEGLCPLIESDEDVIEWARHLFESHVLDDAELPVIVIKGDTAIIEGDKFVMEIVKRHILD